MAKTPVFVDLWYDDTWNDVTEDVYTRDPITITRGRRDESRRISPSVLRLSLKNDDGTFSPRNPDSVLYGLIGRNTPIRCYAQPFFDGFDRTETNQWGFAPDGQGWSTFTIGGSSADFDVANSEGTMVIDGDNEYRLAVLNFNATKLRDCEVRTQFEIDTNDVNGAPLEPANLILRYQDTSNYHFLRVSISTSNVITVAIHKLVNAAETVLASAELTGLTFSGQTLRAAFACEGPIFMGKVWANSEPQGWQVMAVDIVDTSVRGFEDFEDTNFAFTWSFTGAAWERTSADSHSGSWAFSDSTAVGSDWIVDVPAGATEVTFWYNIIGSGAELDVFVDAAKVADLPDVSGWTRAGPYDVTGASTVTFVFDDGPFAGDVYIDDVRFEFAEAPSGYVGVRNGAAFGNSNVPVTVSHDYIEVRIPQMYGEVESWPQRWSVDENDAWVPIEANGILRRLGASGQRPLAKPAFYRYVLSGAQGGLRAYWPADDGSGSVVGLPATPGTGDLTVTFQSADAGTTRFAEGEIVEWMPLVVSGRGDTVSEYTIPGTRGSGTNLDIVALVRAGLPTEAGAAWGMWILNASTAGGSTFAYTFVCQWNDGSPSLVLYRAEQPALTLTSMHTYDGSDASKAWDDKPHLWGIGLWQNGSDIAVVLNLDGQQIGGGAFTHSSATLWPSTLTPMGQLATDGVSDFAGGHHAVWLRSGGSGPDQAAIFAAAQTAYDGETAVERIERLCDEEGIAVVAYGDSELVGPQNTAPVIDLLHDAANADGGILFEPKSFFGLAYASRAAMVDQFPTATLDYSANEVAPPLEPTEDTEYVQNDISITRRYGGSVRIVKETGALNVKEPGSDSKAVGRYAVDEELNLSTDDQLAVWAANRLRAGTVDEMRFPSITFSITDLVNQGKHELVNNVLSLNPSNLLVVENPPVWTGGIDLNQIVQGYSMELGSHNWKMRVNATPAAAYQTKGLSLPGTSGSYASTPDSALLDITGDIDLRAEITAVDWTPSVVDYILSKYNTTGNQRAYALRLSTSGTIDFVFSTDGTNSTVVSSTESVPFLNGERGAIRTTLDASDGSGGRIVAFYTAPCIDGPWTQLGDPVTGTSITLNSSTASLVAGARNEGSNDNFTGVIHAVQVYSGINGLIRANARFQEIPAGTTSFTDIGPSYSRTWTVNGDAEII